MPEINVQNRKVYYREWGRGGDPTILILHGWGVDSSQYEKFGLRLAKKGYRTIVPDLPGWGNTPAPAKAWSVSDYMEWVNDFIKTVVVAPSPDLTSVRSPSPLGRGKGEGRLILFGHSFGGRIAIKYAVKYPEQLRGLILCAAAGIKPPLTLKRIGLYCLAKIGRTIFQPPGLSFTGEILKRMLYRIAGVTDYLKARGIMKEVLAKTVKEDLKPLLSKIKIPTLILWGTEDRATPYKDGQTMSRLIPNAKLITFEGERHNLPKHIPEKVANEIIKYAASISPP